MKNANSSFQQTFKMKVFFCPCIIVCLGIFLVAKKADLQVIWHYYPFEYKVGSTPRLIHKLA